MPPPLHRRALVLVALAYGDVASRPVPSPTPGGRMSSRPNRVHHRRQPRASGWPSGCAPPPTAPTSSSPARPTTPHPKLPGTIHTAAAAIEAAGGRALAVAMDVRDEPQVRAAVEGRGRALRRHRRPGQQRLGHLPDRHARHADPALRPDAPGQHARHVPGDPARLPHLLRAANPHVLNIAPPLNLNPRWFAPHLAYTMAKYGMSLCVLGMAEEFRAQGVAVNALWPRTAIDTAAITPDRRRGDPPPADARARRSSPTPPTPS